MAGQPLRRTSDRVEEAGRRVCVTAALLGTLCGVVVAWFSHESATDAAERYAATHFRTEAVTLEDASDRPSVPGNPIPPVDAEWIGADRIVRRGELQVPSGSDAGYEVPIWTMENGEITDAPPSRAQLVIDAAFVASKIMMGIGGAAFVAFQLLRYGLNRLRYREWDRAWERVSTRHSSDQ